MDPEEVEGVASKRSGGEECLVADTPACVGPDPRRRLRARAVLRMSGNFVVKETCHRQGSRGPRDLSPRREGLLVDADCYKREITTVDIDGTTPRARATLYLTLTRNIVSVCDC